MPDPNPSFANPTDEALAAELGDLLRQAAQGNAQAFEQFYTGSVRYAFALVRRVAGYSLCDDVLADAYFQAWRDAKRFDATRGSALAWLLTIARSRALDRLRYESLRHGGMAEAPESADTPDPAPGPELLIQGTQQNTRLHAAIAALSSNERWVLGLAYYKDLSHAEIAAQTQLPLGTVKSLIHRAQQKLRETLGSGSTATATAL